MLRLERDNRELERSLQVAKQSSERVSAEMEKTSRRLTAQIHADKKEIARLKEVRETNNKCGHIPVFLLRIWHKHITIVLSISEANILQHSSFYRRIFWCVVVQ